MKESSSVREKRKGQQPKLQGFCTRSWEKGQDDANLYVMRRKSAPQANYEVWVKFPERKS